MRSCAISPKFSSSTAQYRPHMTEPARIPPPAAPILKRRERETYEPLDEDLWAKFMAEDSSEQNGVEYPPSRPVLPVIRDSGGHNGYDLSMPAGGKRMKLRGGGFPFYTLEQVLEASAVAHEGQPSGPSGALSSGTVTCEHGHLIAPPMGSEHELLWAKYDKSVTHDCRMQIMIEEREKRAGQSVQDELKMSEEQIDSYVTVDKDGMVTLDGPGMSEGNEEEWANNGRFANLSIRREDVTSEARKSWTLETLSQAIQQERASAKMVDIVGLPTDLSSGDDRGAPYDTESWNAEDGNPADKELEPEIAPPTPQTQAPTSSDAVSLLTFTGQSASAVIAEKDGHSSLETVHPIEDVDSDDCQEISGQDFWKNHFRHRKAARC